jgi:hypothetical protein
MLRDQRQVAQSRVPSDSHEHRVPLGLARPKDDLDLERPMACGVPANLLI